MNYVGKAALTQQVRKSNANQSGIMAMATDHNNKLSKQKNKKHIGSESGGIHDDDNDWLSRQLKEEDMALRRMEAEFGLRHFSSDAQKLKTEHAVEHAIDRYKGIRR